MANYSFNKYIPSLSSVEKAEAIYLELVTKYNEDQKLEIDMTGMVAMSTICARKTFGRFCKEIGEDDFYDNVTFINLIPELENIIDYAIEIELGA